MANVDSFIKKQNDSVTNYTKTSSIGKNRVQSKPIRFACRYITACISVAKPDKFPHAFLSHSNSHFQFQLSSTSLGRNESHYTQNHNPAHKNILFKIKLHQTHRSASSISQITNELQINSC